MNEHVLLNLLNGLRKRDKMRGLVIILSLFCNELINLIIQEHEFNLSHDTITKQSHFWHENVKILPTTRTEEKNHQNDLK